MKIGVVPYLNAYPLYYYLDHPVIKETPAKLSQMMESGDLDLALLPVFTYFKNPKWQIIPEAGGIISRGSVKSVMIFYKNHLQSSEEIKTIQYTTDSRTSVGLTKVLRRFYWKQPDFIEVDENPDAVLEIGDRALTFDQTGYKSIDLGEIWTNWTNLPFVYAAWISRVDPSPVKNQLIQAKEKGLENISEVIKNTHELDLKQRKEYLTQNIFYELDDQALRGMEVYRNYLKKI
jgi:chorismate dehydratase